MSETLTLTNAARGTMFTIRATGYAAHALTVDLAIIAVANALRPEAGGTLIVAETYPRPYAEGDETVTDRSFLIGTSRDARRHWECDLADDEYPGGSPEWAA